ncbi:hypothetical protein [Helicobacter bilis]|uniref:hypothetical protein n=1 Tax=Helicobacter bilis TaxID=37372 RepID=UPI000B1C51EC|nr:hypothetical protein [Helicobacter bilis]MCI7411482.1 hypothetical protein [Helicobacter bilis]MDD7296235.1 hypothetical protein [Helicobacter bilis]MDY4400388.1 hypothetical protein [Helicobacter bilis]
MADKDKTKDSHRKHSDFMNPYDEYNNEATHHFDIATKQWLTNGDFYQNKVIECFIKADIQCNDTLIAEIESSLYFRFISWEYMYEEIDERIEILKAQKQPPQM